MNAYLSRTICAFIFAQALFLCSTLFAQFLVPTNGPEGGAVSGVTELSNGNLYASVGSIGIVESTDSGLSWHPIASEPENGLQALISDQQDRLYTHSIQTVFRLDSLNGEWQVTADLLVEAIQDYWQIAKLIVDSEDRLFTVRINAGHCYEGIDISEDQGNSWQTLANTPFDSLDFVFQDFTVDHSGQLWIVGFVYDSPLPLRVFNSNSDLTSWTVFQYTSDNLNSVRRIVADDNGYIFINTDNSILRYNPLTERWVEFVPPPGDFWYLYSKNTTGSIITGQEDGTYESTNHGDSWTRIGDIPVVYPRSIYATANNGLLGLHPHTGLSRLSRTTQEWTLANNGIVSTEIKSLVAGGNSIYANIEDIAFKSTDRGDSWTDVFGGKRVLNRIEGNPPILFSSNWGDSLYRSVDEGENWTTVLPRWISSVEETSSGALIAGGDSLWRSTDRGLTWEPLNNANQLIELDYYETHIVICDDAVFGFVTDFSLPQLLRSYDDGVTWEEISGFQFTEFCMLISDGYGHLFCYDQLNGHWFHRSDDYGDTWTELENFPTEGNYRTIALHPASDGRLFAQYYTWLLDEDYGALFKSQDFGENWTEIPGDYPRIHCFVEDSDGYLYAGTWNNGIYISSETILPVSHATNPLPTEFTLYQNYPNPFNSTTTFAFDLPATGPVTMQVFDITGRLTATPISGNLTAGHHTINWDAKSLASGIYFYRLQAAENIQTRKLILIK